MTNEERCELVLQMKEPERALRALVLDLGKEGLNKSEIYSLLENVLAKLRMQHGGEEREDPILNVMDALTGWCHPAAQLLPDDSSLSPSDARS